MATIKFTNEVPTSVVSSINCKIPTEILTASMKLGYVAVRVCKAESTKKKFVADGIITPTIKYNGTKTRYTTDVLVANP